jgi:hypothetical protein
MTSQKLAGVLWLIAGISSGGIAFFLVDPIDLAIFIGGAVLAVLLAIAMLVRPSPAWVTWSNLLGAAWLLAFGWVNRPVPGRLLLRGDYHGRPFSPVDTDPQRPVTTRMRFAAHRSGCDLGTTDGRVIPPHSWRS